MRAHRRKASVRRLQAVRAPRKKGENGMHIRSPIEWLFGQADLATDHLGAAQPAEYFPPKKLTARPEIREISRNDLRLALRLGVKDFAAAR
jgi:hypothetical protein